MNPPGLTEAGYLPRSGGGERGAKARARSSKNAGAAPWGTDAPVWAYCRELCGVAASDRAVAAILTKLGNGRARTSEQELLRLTRTTAAQFAFAGLAGSSGKLTDRLDRACSDTPARLAARAGGTLEAGERLDLAAHLQKCLTCRALAIKLERAERGFATLEGGAVVREPLVDRAKPAAPAATRYRYRYRYR